MLLAPTLALLLSGASVSAPLNAQTGARDAVALATPAAAFGAVASPLATSTPAVVAPVAPATVNVVRIAAVQDEKNAQATAGTAGVNEPMTAIEAPEEIIGPAVLGPIEPELVEADPLPIEVTQSDGEHVFADESDDAVVQKIIDHLQSVDTLTADFEQSSPSGSVSEGKLWLRRPRQLRMQYGASEDAQDDAPLLIVASQGFVYVRDNALETTDSYPVNKTPLRFLLSKKVALDDLDVLAVYRSADSVSVTFVDPEGETEGDLTAVFDAPGLTLKQWIVRDPQQGVTIVTLSNRQSGARLANRLFRTPEAGGQFINN